MAEGSLFGRVRFGGHLGVQRMVAEVAMWAEGFKFPLTVTSCLGGVVGGVVFVGSLTALKPPEASLGYALTDGGGYRYYPADYLQPVAAQLRAQGWQITTGSDGLSRVTPPAGQRLEDIGPAGELHARSRRAFDVALALSGVGFALPFAGIFAPLGNLLMRRRRLEYLEQPHEIHRFPSLKNRQQILDETEMQKALYLLVVALRGLRGLGPAQLAFKRFSDELQADRYVEGPRVMDLEEFREAVEGDPKFGKGRLAFISRGGEWMTMPDSLICKHLLFFGAVGTGKTTMLLPMVDSAIRQNIKCIISDVKPEYCTYYPQAVRLNVMDKLGVAYNIFADLRTMTDCWEAGKALVPFEPGATRDGFFDPAVEMVLGGILVGCWLRWQNTGDPTWATWGRVIEILFGDKRGQDIPWKAAFDFLMEHVETQAAAYMVVDKGDLAKQSGGVWAGVQQKLRFLEMFRAYADVLPHESFSFVEYVADPADTRPVIISYPPQYKQEMLPILRFFYTSAFTQSLGLPERPKTARGAYLVFFIDELPDILGAATDRLANSFLTLVTQVRSKGVAVISATQDLGILKQGLGEGRLESFVNNCGTIITAQVGHPDLAEFVSKIFGVQTIEKASPGASAGQVDMADRGSVSWQRDDKRPVVSPSDITTLAPCTYFLKIGGSYITFLDRVDYFNPPQLLPAFEPMDVRRVATLEPGAQDTDIALDTMPDI